MDEPPVRLSNFIWSDLNTYAYEQHWTGSAGWICVLCKTIIMKEEVTNVRWSRGQRRSWWREGDGWKWCKFSSHVWNSHKKNLKNWCAYFPQALWLNHGLQQGQSRSGGSRELLTKTWRSSYPFIMVPLIQTLFCCLFKRLNIPWVTSLNHILIRCSYFCYCVSCTFFYF